MGVLIRKVGRALLPIRRRATAFAGAERGATLIEFGLLGLPFFAIIAAILETSMVFLAGQVLDSAVDDATRFVRTGQAQTANLTQANFRTKICDNLYGLFDCNGLKIKVSVINTFASTGATITPPINPNCTDPNPENCWTLVESYAPGTGSSIVLVQAYYKWPVLVNFGGFNLANQPDSTRLLAAVRVFRNEPFS